MLNTKYNNQIILIKAHQFVSIIFNLKDLKTQTYVKSSICKEKEKWIMGLVWKMWGSDL